MLAAIYLSIVLSNDLTKDIKKLNKTLGDFIRSGFKDTEGSQPETLSSKITEVQGLNDDFNYLRQTLKQTLSDLENSIQEEKQVSSAHELTIIKLREQIKEMEKQK